MTRGLLLLSILLAAVGCSAPMDPLWHEEIDAQLVLWDVANDELRVRFDLSPPSRQLDRPSTELRLRLEDLRVAEAAVDVDRSTLTHETTDEGLIKAEYRAPLVQSGLATEQRLTLRGQVGVLLRSLPKSATIPDMKGQKDVVWEHPEVPGLRLTLAYWTDEALGFSVERPTGGFFELIAMHAGRRLETEELTVAGVVRLSFLEPLPPGAVISVHWRDEWRCRAFLDEVDAPGREAP